MHIQSSQAAALSDRPGTAPFERLAGVATLITATAAIVGALLSGFDNASPTEWRAPTPEVLAEAVRCGQPAGRDAQTACTQEFATAPLSKAPTSFQVAQR